jgi:hypothetical protein
LSNYNGRRDIASYIGRGRKEFEEVHLLL